MEWKKYGPEGEIQYTADSKNFLSIDALGVAPSQ